MLAVGKKSHLQVTACASMDCGFALFQLGNAYEASQVIPTYLIRTRASLHTSTCNNYTHVCL